MHRSGGRYGTWGSASSVFTGRPSRDDPQPRDSIAGAIVDFDEAERHGALLVRRALYRGQLKDAKGRRRRYVPWPPALVELFAEYRRWMVAVEHPALRADLLFGTEEGTPLVNGSL